MTLVAEEQAGSERDEPVWREAFWGIRRRSCLAFRDLLLARLIQADCVSDDLFQLILTDASRMIDLTNAIAEATVHQGFERMAMFMENEQLYDEIRNLKDGYIQGTVPLPESDEERRKIMSVIARYIEIVFDSERTFTSDSD